jgi:hypothetical protein
MFFESLPVLLGSPEQQNGPLSTTRLSCSGWVCLEKGGREAEAVEGVRKEDRMEGGRE